MKQSVFGFVTVLANSGNAVWGVSVFTRDSKSIQAILHDDSGAWRTLGASMQTLAPQPAKSEDVQPGNEACN